MDPTERAFRTQVVKHLSVLIESDADVVLTSITGPQFNIGYRKRKRGYITLRPCPSNPTQVLVDLQPKTSGGLGMGKAESPIPWSALEGFVKNNLINPFAK